MSDDDRIVKCAIHPAIGIARLGNSPMEPFFGPQFPGQIPDPPYKDGDGRIRKQAALFRVYGLDKDGNVVREIHEGEPGVTIKWTVHVANRKANWYKFRQAMDRPSDRKNPAVRRNAKVAAADRDVLVIDPGLKPIAGSAQGPVVLEGKFFGKRVKLGELRTDAKGRLIVVGGEGSSEAADGVAPATDLDNDNWRDDISDGPVWADVVIKGRKIVPKPAFVVVAPPNYGQGLRAIVTMYDVVSELFGREPARVSFWRDIYPIFERLTQCQWVNSGLYFLFGANSPSDFTAQPLLDRLADPSDRTKALRGRLFDWFRDPSDSSLRPEKLPPFYGDLSFKQHADPNPHGTASLTVTARQYNMLKKWAAGEFTNDPVKKYASFDKIDAEDQPGALDRAALEECIGGPFHPGAEMPWIMRVRESHNGKPLMWDEPFRLKALPQGASVQDDFGDELKAEVCLAEDGPLAMNGPGTLTRWMGLPWQADAASCLSGYNFAAYLPLPSFWAVRVPNQVLSNESFERLSDPSLPLAQRLKHLDHRQFWLRDFDTQDYGTSDELRVRNMIDSWSDLGIVAPQRLLEDAQAEGIPDTVWVETGRKSKAARNDATLRALLIAEDIAEDKAKP